MELVLEIILFIAIGLFVHSYFLYPIIIYIISSLIKKKYKVDDNYEPHISIIISAFNEEKVIEKTLNNFMQCNYDPSKIEIVVGSDRSEDRTDEIIQQLTKKIKAIKFFPFRTRRGKAQVLNDLVSKASGEILIFSDANTIYKKDALKNLVKYYVDSRVGGVCGRLTLLDVESAEITAKQEQKYWMLESWLKEREGRIGCLIGANGGIYSIRKNLFFDIPSEHPVMDDLFVALKVLSQHKDFLYCSKAIAEEFIAPTAKAEFYRKIRNNSINILTLQKVKELLNPVYKIISFNFWSHKVIRWITPLLLISLLLANLGLYFLFDKFFFLFAGQIAFYFLAVIGYVLRKLNMKNTLILLPYYFVLTNVAMLIGINKVVFSKQTAFWQSTPR